jgi:hypothetical protein
MQTLSGTGRLSWAGKSLGSSVSSSLRECDNIQYILSMGFSVEIPDRRTRRFSVLS